MLSSSLKYERGNPLKAMDRINKNNLGCIARLESGVA